MSLVTRCPKCHSDFVVKLKELQAHDGLVRCGSCEHIFDGYETLQSDLPTLTERPDSVATVKQVRESEPSGEPAVLRHRARIEAAQVTAKSENVSAAEAVRMSFSARAREPEPDDVDLSILGESRLRDERGAAGRTQPEFLVDQVDTQRLKMLLWGLASALALILLVIQLAYVYRNDLATKVPSLRPMLVSMCVTLKCEVSLRRHLERISVAVVALERLPGTEPEGSATQKLVLKFSMRNRFNQAQPWPSLALELTDASGTVVLRKPLGPHEYLPRELADKPFAAAQEVNLNVPVTVKGLQINGYTLKPFFP